MAIDPLGLTPLAQLQPSQTPRTLAEAPSAHAPLRQLHPMALYLAPLLPELAVAAPAAATALVADAESEASTPSLCKGSRNASEL